MHVIVAIDGPAGAGKSSVARALAGRLGFAFLDTGAMYRAVALAALRQGVDLNESNELARLARAIKIELDGERVWLDGADVTHEIRTLAVTNATHHVAGNPSVREHLVDMQRQWADKRSLVTEGRDQGTVVFPKANYKFYLTASPEERARRRLKDLLAHGESISFEEVLAAQSIRDERDQSRTQGPLKPAPDAVQIQTDGMAPEDVIGRLESLIRMNLVKASGEGDP